MIDTESRCSTTAKATFIVITIASTFKAEKQYGTSDDQGRRVKRLGRCFPRRKIYAIETRVCSNCGFTILFDILGTSARIAVAEEFRRACAGTSEYKSAVNSIRPFDKHSSAIAGEVGKRTPRFPEHFDLR